MEFSFGEFENRVANNCCPKTGTMNKQELKKALIEMGIPSSYYNLDGVGKTDERFCLECVNDEWKVYFRERGNKTTNESFVSEEEACRFIYDQLV